MKIAIEGWFTNKRKDVLLDSYRLDESSYIQCVRQLDIEDIEKLDSKKYIGGFFTPIVLVGFSIIKGSQLYPFFVKEEKANELTRLIEANRASAIRL